MNKAMLISILMGLLGMILSAVIFVVVAIKTEYIFGWVAIICGAISGGLFGLGYMIGDGKITKRSANTFLQISMAFGLFGVIAAYFGPYIYFLSKGVPFMFYWTILDFGFMDVLFIIIGAYGGRWAGAKVGNMILFRSGN